MKALRNLAITTLALTAGALISNAETTVFHDTFGSSTTNQTSTPGGTPEASSTSYDIASTKDGRTCSIAPGQLRVKLGGNTTAGYIELQAIFASTPVQLVNVGDRINLTFTFTNVANLLAGGGGSVIDVGLFNSDGALPLAGNLVNAGLGSAATYTNGNCQNWQGYVGQINYSGSASSIYTRPVQDGASPNNGVQDLLFSNAGTGLYKFPAGTTIGGTMTSAVTLGTGAVYTRSFTIELSAVNEVTITDELYSGTLAAGIPLSSMVRTTTGGSTYVNNANQYDSLAIGIANKGTSLNPQMDITGITVTTGSASENALYNLQLNGFTGSTFSGPAQTGSSGDLWNNPDWVGVGTSSTTLFSGVTLLDSTGADYGVTATLTSKFTDTNAWNSGTFNHYTGQTSGSATPVLMDQVAKIDYNAGLGGVNAMTLSVSGLPTNTPVTVYVYGAGNGSGQGGVWKLPANGGDSAVIAFDGSATGRDVTLASSQGKVWEVLSGMSDALGNLVVAGTNYSGSGVGTWWQIYMNGMQIRVGGEAPAIFGLTNQTVEVGSTANLSPLVTGNPVPTYQWQTNGVDLTDATNATLTLVNVTTDQSGIVYSLIANNVIGSATNSMTLTVLEPVYSAMTVTSVSPANSATDICSDTPLTVTFSDSVSLGTIGSIRIFNATNSATPVDTIDVALGAVQQRTFPGDGQLFSYRTLEISGNTVKIYPHFNVMTSDQIYYVTIDPKAFKDSGGTNFVGLTDTNAWQFTTKSAPADPASPVVNADSSADFLTVQGALNSLPSGTNATQRVVNIRNGLYNEMVNISGKHNVTFRGESRHGAVISFPNNASYQAANGGTTHARMNFKVNANDVALESLTVSNSTPQGGTQAEALMIETGAARCIVNNCDIASRQDTILANVNSSQCHFYQTLIKGNFDYIWGGGNLFFEECEIRTIAGSSSFNITAARTTTSGTQSSSFPWLNPGGTYTANGMSFVNCSFTAEPGVGAVTLAGGNGTAGNNVSWFGCDFATNYVAPSASLFSGNYLFWQADNTMTNDPVTFAVLTTLTGADPELQAATNKMTWFYGWEPALAPNILTQPLSQSVTEGDPVVFTVNATGIPAPAYQWKHAGTNLIGETNATLSIASAQSTDAGGYEAEASNIAGSVTSAAATLTVGPGVSADPTDIVVEVSSGNLNLSWPADHTGWSLQVQTNSLGAGLGTNWTTLGYEGTNAVSLPIDAANPSVFYRLIYQVP